jgi:hypothetical protein
MLQASLRGKPGPLTGLAKLSLRESKRADLPLRGEVT